MFEDVHFLFFDFRGVNRIGDIPPNNPPSYCLFQGFMLIERIVQAFFERLL